MRMEGEQPQAAQAHSLTAYELSALVPAASDVADMQGKLWSQNFCLMETFLRLLC